MKYSNWLLFGVGSLLLMERAQSGACVDQKRLMEMANDLRQAHGCQMASSFVQCQKELGLSESLFAAAVVRAATKASGVVPPDGKPCPLPIPKAKRASYFWDWVIGEEAIALTKGECYNVMDYTRKAIEKNVHALNGEIRDLESKLVDAKTYVDNHVKYGNVESLRKAEQTLADLNERVHRARIQLLGAYDAEKFRDLEETLAQEDVRAKKVWGELEELREKGRSRTLSGDEMDKVKELERRNLEYARGSQTFRELETLKKSVSEAQKKAGNYSLDNEEMSRNSARTEVGIRRDYVERMKNPAVKESVLKMARSASSLQTEMDTLNNLKEEWGKAKVLANSENPKNWGVLAKQMASLDPTNEKTATYLDESLIWMDEVLEGTSKKLAVAAERGALTAEQASQLRAVSSASEDVAEARKSIAEKVAVSRSASDLARGGATAAKGALLRGASLVAARVAGFVFGLGGAAAVYAGELCDQKSEDVEVVECEVQVGSLGQVNQVFGNKSNFSIAEWGQQNPVHCDFIMKAHQKFFGGWKTQCHRDKGVAVAQRTDGLRLVSEYDNFGHLQSLMMSRPLGTKPYSQTDAPIADNNRDNSNLPNQYYQFQGTKLVAQPNADLMMANARKKYGFSDPLRMDGIKGTSDPVTLQVVSQWMANCCNQPGPINVSASTCKTVGVDLEQKAKCPSGKDCNPTSSTPTSRR